MKPVIYLGSLLICSLSIFLSSCKITCRNPLVAIRFSNFNDTSDLSVIHLKNYQKATNFAQLVTADTFHGPVHPQISDSYDWIIELPNAGRTYKLTVDIPQKKEPDQHLVGENDICFNDVTYYVNGEQTVLLMPKDASNLYETAYIEINK